MSRPRVALPQGIPRWFTVLHWRFASRKCHRLNVHQMAGLRLAGMCGQCGEVLDEGICRHAGIRTG